MKCFTTVLSEGLTTAIVHSKIAQAYFYLGDYKKADEFYTNALKKRKDANDYGDRGFAHFYSGSLAGARADFKEQLRLDTASAEARHGLSSVYVEAGFRCIKRKEYQNACDSLDAAKQYLFALLESGKFEDFKTELFTNTEAFFVNYHLALTKLGKRTELEELHNLYLKAQGLGFISDKVSDLFK